MGELGALFNPGMRHELEERQAKAARREEEGNARDGDLRIDLESGVAVINIPGADQEQAVADDQPAAESADALSASKVRPAGEAASASETAPADEAAPATNAPAAAAVLRPRGKRGLSASNR